MSTAGGVRRGGGGRGQPAQPPMIDADADADAGGEHLRARRARTRPGYPRAPLFRVLLISHCLSPYVLSATRSICGAMVRARQRRLAAPAADPLAVCAHERVVVRNHRRRDWVYSKHGVARQRPWLNRLADGVVQDADLRVGTRLLAALAGGIERIAGAEGVAVLARRHAAPNYGGRPT